MNKKSYEAPMLEHLGKFETFTRGGTRGRKFDATFENDAPVPFNDQGQPIVFS